MISMNKRFCRKYLDPEWKPNLNSGVLYLSQITYVVHTDVKNIAGHRTLLLYFYATEKIKAGVIKPSLIVFQTLYEYFTYDQLDETKTRWRVSCIDNIYVDSSHYYCPSIDKKSCFYSRKDELRVMQFCKNHAKTGFEAIYHLQTYLFTAKCRQRKEAKELKIKNRMKPIRPYPKDIEKWAIKEVFPAHAFYTYKKHKKQQLCYCTNCKTENLISGVRHAHSGVCPNCGRMITFHAMGRHPRVYDQITTQYIDKVGNEYLLRIIKGSVSYTNNYTKPEYRFWENARCFISAKNQRLYTEPYYHSYSFNSYPWRAGARPHMNKWQYHFESDVCGNLYTKNLDKLFQSSPWQYCPIKDFYEFDREPLEVLPFMRTYLQSPMLEYLVKLRLYRLAADFVYQRSEGFSSYNNCLNTSGKSLRDVLKVSPTYLPLMQAINISMKTCSLLQKIIAKGIVVNEDLLRWCQKHDIYDADDLAICLRHMSAYKMIQYLQQQHDELKAIVVPFAYQPYGTMNSVFTLYKDYIYLCEMMKYDLSNTIVLYPNHLKEVHDNTAKLFDEDKVRIYNQCIADSYSELTKQYQFKKHGMLIKVPQTSDDIVAEGQALHHCVNSYVERVAKKQCSILFLREKEQPDKPFYTIEIRKEEVVQVRGFDNCDPSPKVRRFIEEWQKKKVHSAAAMLKAA